MGPLSFYSVEFWNLSSDKPKFPLSEEQAAN